MSSIGRKRRRRFQNVIRRVDAQMGAPDPGEALARWAYNERLLIYDAESNTLLPKEGWTYESIAQAWRAKRQIEGLNFAHNKEKDVLRRYLFRKAERMFL